MKKIVILLCASLLFLQTAVADITVNTGTDNTLAVLDGNGSGTCSLREALQNANDGAQTYKDCTAGAAGADIIKFSGASTINLIDNIFVISDVTIKGPIKISGQNMTRIFTVASSNGKLRLIDNTSIENGKNASGGAIGVNDIDCLLQCKNSSFKNNKADNNGGAILSSGTLDIDACKFEGNQAGNDGGAISKGGGSSLVATLTINASDFIDNKAGTDTQEGGVGGALSFVSTSIGNITTTRFNKNTASSGANSSDNRGGGAIHTSGVLNITASAFAGNKVNAANANSSQKWHGGAIFNDSDGVLSVNFSHFGLTLIPLPAPFDTLTDANEVSGTEGIGGAIYNFGDMFILGSSFIGNKSAAHGGAIGTATNTDSLFSNVIEVLFDGATIANSMLSGNTAAARGGAIYSQRADTLINIINTTIANNIAAQGGGIYNEGDGDNFDTTNDEVLLSNTIVANNTAGVGANCGGGTSSSEGTNNVVFPGVAACPNAVLSSSANPVIGGTPELTFSIANILNYTLPIGAGSSALGNGNPVVCANFPIINLDQRGFPRPQGDTNCDVGSYEAPDVGMPSPTPTNTRTNTPTNTATSTNTPTNTATFTSTNTPTITATFTSTNTPTITATSTQTSTSTNTPTITQTRTSTNTPTITQTQTSTNTPTITRTSTSTNTPTITRTATRTNTPTNTNVGPTSTFTATSTATSTSTATNTNVGPTSTFTATSTPTSTETATASATGTESPSPTPTETPVVSATATAVVTGTQSSNVTPSISNDPGCTEIDVQNSQFILDGQAANQKRLIQRARALALRGTPTKSQQTSLNKIFQSATSAYIRMWSGIWSFQRIVQKCTNTVLCKNVDISQTAAAFKKDSDLMAKLLNDAVKILRAVQGNKSAGSNLVKQMTKLSGLNVTTLATVPSVTSDCTIPQS